MNLSITSELYNITSFVPGICDIINAYYICPLIICIDVNAYMVSLSLEILGKVVIDWGDNSAIEKHSYNNKQHNYINPGIYNVKVYGNCVFNKHIPTIQKCLINIKNFGGLFVQTGTFHGCKKLQYVPSSASRFNLSTNIDNLFEECFNLNCELKWNTSHIINMSSVFSNCTGFNSDISCWDTKNVVDMSYMFFGAELFNKDISRWNIEKVRTVEGMFVCCNAFEFVKYKWDLSNKETRWITSLFI